MCVWGGVYSRGGERDRGCVDVCVWGGRGGGGGCMDVAVDVTGQDENRDNSSCAD